MTKQKLSDVCLCSIVRDEEMNPAGGILDFINSTVPFVENAVIVDTGSTDKTRDLLEDSKSKYPNLQVLDYLFDGYAQARNFSLAHARNFGNYALILDADERLFTEDFSKLGRELKNNPIGINFMIQDIFLNIEVQPSYCGLHNPRCFSLDKKEKFYYKNIKGKDTYCEWLYEANRQAIGNKRVIDSMISIKHFLPPTQNGLIKKENWYELFSNPKTQAQSKDPNFRLWKQLNPKRLEYP